jgi:hypothetical protein
MSGDIDEEAAAAMQRVRAAVQTTIGTNEEVEAQARDALVDVDERFLLRLAGCASALLSSVILRDLALLRLLVAFLPRPPPRADCDDSACRRCAAAHDRDGGFQVAEKSRRLT